MTAHERMKLTALRTRFLAHDPAPELVARFDEIAAEVELGRDWGGMRTLQLDLMEIAARERAEQRQRGVEETPLALILPPRFDQLR